MKPRHHLLLCILIAACSTDRAADRHGFVTRLGDDTISVEQVSRRGDTVTIEGVDRFPFVRRRHTEVVLAGDGRMQRLRMDIRTPNAPVALERERRFTALIRGDSLVVTTTDSGGTETLAFAVGSALTMPHVPQVYGLAELYLAAAMARGSAEQLAPGDSVHVTQFYPDVPFSRFPIHDGYVHPVAGGKVELWHDWLAGIGDATMDSRHRLLAYSGARSTYKVDVVRVSAPLDVDATFARLVTEEKARGAGQLSVRDTVRATIGAATFTVDYGRPLARGRTLLGNVITYDAVWRTGANAATQFTTSARITVVGMALAPGTYTLWTVPRADGRADLIVNRQVGQWGTGYDDAHDVGMAPLVVATTPDPVDAFTIAITPADTHHGTLVLTWGTFRWSAPIVVP